MIPSERSFAHLLQRPFRSKGEVLEWLNAPEKFLWGYVQLATLFVPHVRSLLQNFEELVDAHMFASVAAPSPNVAPEFVRYRCLVEREAVKQAVNTMGQTNIKKWLNKAS